jgi:hypothetical protein
VGGAPAGGPPVDGWVPTTPLGWPPAWATGRPGDPDVERLLDVLAKAGPSGLTVPELEQAVGRRKTWLYDRLAELVRAEAVERLGQGRHRLRHLSLLDPQRQP